MKRANVLDPATGLAEKETQLNCETSSAQAASSMVTAGRTTLSRNSQRSKQAASVKSHGQDAPLDAAIKSEQPSIRSDVPTQSDTKPIQATKQKTLPNQENQKRKKYQNTNQKKANNSNFNSTDTKNIFQNTNTQGSKKVGQSNQQLNVMSSSFINPLNGPQSQRQAVAGQVLPVNLFSQQNSQQQKQDQDQLPMLDNAEKEAEIKKPDPNDKVYCIINGNGYNIIKKAMEAKPGWREIKKDVVWNVINGSHSSHFVNFIWKPVNFNYKMYSQIDHQQYRGLALLEQEGNPNRQIVVNHLEGHRELTTKTGLIRSLKYYYKDTVHFIEQGYQVFDTMPTSFVVSSKLAEYEYAQFIERYQELAQYDGDTVKEKLPQKHCRKNIWLIKPANENQGKGIKILDDLNQIIRFLESSLQFSYWVIQKYIEKPLLFKNRKFDIRMWGFAHSNNEFYFYNTGYLRTSSQEYTTEVNQDDEYVHLTNNCLQIKNKDTYGMHEEGNVVGFEQFQQYLDEQYPQYDLEIQRDFVSRMKDIAIDCYMSCRNTLNPSKRKNSFEFFGFDFMIDEDFRVWLIEVNTNPQVANLNKRMSNLLPKMFNDMFKITLDTVFEEMTTEEKNTIHEQTDFDLLYSRNKGINKRRGVHDGIYPIKELDTRKTYPRKNFGKRQRKNIQLDTSVGPTNEEKQHPASTSSALKAPDATNKNEGEDDSGNKGMRKQSVQGNSRFNMTHANRINNQTVKRTQSQSEQFDQNNAAHINLHDVKKELFSAQSPEPSTKNKTKRKISLMDSNDSKSFSMTKKRVSNCSMAPQADAENINRSNSKPPLKQGNRNIKANLTFTTPQVQKSENKKGGIHGTIQEDKNEQSPNSFKEAPTVAVVPVGPQPKFRKPKTVVDQVRALDHKSQFAQQHIQQALNSVTAIFKSWELFSDTEIKDANTGLKMMLQTVSLEIDQQVPLIKLLGQLIGSNDVPIHLRNDLGKNLFHILKSRQVIRMILDERQSQKEHLRPLFKIMVDNCQQNTAIIDFQNDMDDLQVQCATILTQMMSLNNRKYYIPGETSENTKMRQKAIQSGILIIATYAYLNTSNERLKQYIQNEMLERLDEEDLQLQFEYEEVSFRHFRQILLEQKPAVAQNEADNQQNVQGIQPNHLVSPLGTNRQFDALQEPKKSTSFEGECIQSMKEEEACKNAPSNLQSQKEQINAFLKKRFEMMREAKQREQQLINQRRINMEQREIKLKQQSDKEMQEKRQRAEEAMKRRIQEMRARAERQSNYEKMQRDERNERDAKYMQKQYQTQSPIVQSSQYNSQAQNNHKSSMDNANSVLNNSSIISTTMGANDSASKDLQMSPFAFQEKSQSAQRKRNRTYTIMEEPEQIARIEDQKRQEMMELLRKKAEERRRKENSEKRKRLEQEKLQELELEKQKLIKDKERKMALDDWLRNKRAEEKRKNSMAKFVQKKSTNSYSQYHSNYEKSVDKNLTHTLLPHKIKPVVYDPQQSTNSPQIVEHVKKGSNSTQIMMNKTSIQNVNSVKQQQILMNMSNIAKTINLTEPKNHHDLEYSTPVEMQPFDSSALMLKESDHNSLGLNHQSLNLGAGSQVPTNQKYLNNIHKSRLIRFSRSNNSYIRLFDR